MNPDTSASPSILDETVQEPAPDAVRYTNGRTYANAPVIGVSRPYRPSLFRKPDVHLILNPASSTPEEVCAVCTAANPESPEGRRMRAVVGLVADGVYLRSIREARNRNFDPVRGTLDFREKNRSGKWESSGVLWHLSPFTVDSILAYQGDFYYPGGVDVSDKPLIANPKTGNPLAESTLKAILEKAQRFADAGPLSGPTWFARMYAINAVESPLVKTAVMLARKAIVAGLIGSRYHLTTNETLQCRDMGRYIFQQMQEENAGSFTLTKHFGGLDEARNLWYLAGGWYEFKNSTEDAPLFYPAAEWEAFFLQWLDDRKRKGLY